MEASGILMDHDEAFQIIESIPDSVTKMFVNMFPVHLVKKMYVEKSERPRGDIDAVFLVNSLREFFSEHNVIARTLQGERVGAFFDDEVWNPPVCESSTSSRD